MKLIPKYKGGKSLVKTVSKIIGKQGKIRLQLPEHTAAMAREFVLEPQGNNQYYVHMRTWDGDHVPAQLSPEQRKALFEAAYNELPQEAIILAPKSSPDYLATRGTVAGIKRLERDPRFIRWGQPQPLMYTDKDGNTKEMLVTGFRKHPKITLANAVSTPDSEWDNAYNTALEAGDMEEVQRLRDLHATLQPTKTPGIYFRGAKTLQNSYADKYIDPDVGEMNGIYLTKNPKYANTYGNVQKFYLHSNNPLNTEGSWTGVIDNNTRASIEKAGYDAVVNNRFDTGFFNKLFNKSRDETITFNGSNIKLADPVTYDDDGNVIPLSKRDDSTKNDIRWGLFPWLIGTSLLIQNNEK